MTTQELLQGLSQRLKARTADQLASSTGTYQFHLTGDDGGDYTLRVSIDGATIEAGQDAHPGVTITMAAADFKAMAEGQLNPMTAFMSGKLTLTGSMSLAMKLSGLIA